MSLKLFVYQIVYNHIFTSYDGKTVSRTVIHAEPFNITYTLACPDEFFNVLTDIYFVSYSIQQVKTHLMVLV